MITQFTKKMSARYSVPTLCIPKANCNNLCPRLYNFCLDIANELAWLCVLSICHQHHDAFPLPQHLMLDGETFEQC